MKALLFGSTLGEAGRGLAKCAASRRAFFLFGGAFVLYVFLGLWFLNTGGRGDYWEHLAAINAFSRDLLHPQNPGVMVEAPTHLFTPYHWGWGAVSRFSQVTPYHLFPFVGALNALLFVAAARAMAKRIVGDVDSALMVALTLLFFWYRPWAWSGFHHFGLIPLSMINPHWFALPCGLLIVCAFAERERLWQSFLYVPALAVIFVSHPLTGSFMLTAVSLKALLKEGSPLKVKAALLAVAPCALALALFWPFFPVAATIVQSKQFAAMGFAGDPAEFYTRAWLRIAPALLGLGCIAFELRKKRWSLLSACFWAAAAIYAANYFTLFNATLARYITFITLFLQLAIIRGRRLLAPGGLRACATAGYCAILAVCVFLQGRSSLKWTCLPEDLKTGSPLGTHADRRLVGALRSLCAEVTPQSVVMAPLNESWMLPGILGCKVVGLKHTTPFLTDFEDRKRAVDSFFNPRETDGGRRGLLQKYHADFVLIPNALRPADDGAALGLVMTRRNGAHTLYRVSEGGSATGATGSQ